jgi:type IV secretory pathway VirB3-like protein
MYEPRISRVYGALNHIPTLCGIKKPYFVGVCATTMILFIGSKQTLLSLIIGFVAYGFLRFLSRAEPDYIDLYLAAAPLPAAYDAGKFTPHNSLES